MELYKGLEINLIEIGLHSVFQKNEIRTRVEKTKPPPIK